MTLIRADGLKISYQGQVVLSGVDFIIDKGEIVTIVGPNGSGKTSLLKAVVGAIRPDAGKVIITRGLKIGYVPQKLAIDPTLPMRVERFLNLPKRRSADALKKTVEQVGIGALLRRQISELSGGQLQRVLLAQALLGKPDLLILDEPTQGLDQPGEAEFYVLIENIRAQTGCAVLMVSHDLHVVMSATDRVICLNGHVCCEGTPEVVTAAPEYRDLFGKGTRGTLALYRHSHDHHHHDGHDHSHGGENHA